jgi:hypothetical protein
MAKNDRKRRTAKNLAQRKRFLIVVEGSVTEPEYLGAVRRARRISSVDILIVHENTDPLGIVNDAKERQKRAKKIDPYDQVWCVFDTETKLTQVARPGLSDALNIAREGEIKCAVSNPCVELWILWHYQDQNGWISSDQAQRLCRDLGITHDARGKHLSDANSLVAMRYSEAKRRAEGADEKHQRDGTIKPEDRNPSSGIYQLIDAIYDSFPLQG